MKGPFGRPVPPDSREKRYPIDEIVQRLAMVTGVNPDAARAAIERAIKGTPPPIGAGRYVAVLLNALNLPPMKNGFLKFRNGSVIEFVPDDGGPLRGLEIDAIEIDGIRVPPSNPSDRGTTDP